jgi:hypothetical protein
MVTHTLFTALLALALGACSSEDGSGSNSPSGGDDGGCTTAPNCGGCLACFDDCVCRTGDTQACIGVCSSGAGGSGGAGAGGSAAGGTGAGGTVGGAGGSGGSSGPGIQSVTLTTETVTLLPGEEIFKCQNFENPFGGTDVAIVQSESFMTASHHMHVFYLDTSANAPIQDCSGLEFGRLIHGAQTPQVLSSYPEGLGKRIPGSNGIRIQVHLFNTTDQPLESSVSVVLHYTDPSAITAEVASLYMNQPFLNVPAQSTGQASGSCTLPRDANVLWAVSHMHQYATHFVATATTGEQIYEGTDWDEPEARVFSPPLLLRAGTRIDYRCSYDNPTSTALTFGDSAQFNEMCILSAAYYPAPNGEPILCMTGN